MTKFKYYAVRIGKKPGIYLEWNECYNAIKDMPYSRYKGFNDLKEANAFLSQANILKDDTPPIIPKKLLDFDFKKSSVDVYTDGACSNNGKKNAVAGYGVWWGDDHPLNLSEKLEGNQTNQRAELNGAITAIQQAITYNAGELTLHTDSMYTINCMTWSNKWEKNQWKTKSNEDVKNKEDIQLMKKLCCKQKVKWVYVKAHNKNYGNEKADQLAKLSII